MEKITLWIASPQNLLDCSSLEPFKADGHYDIIQQDSLTNSSKTGLVKPDVLMIDYNFLDGLSFFEFIKWLKIQFSCYEIPIFLFNVSADMKQEVWFIFVELGVKDFFGREITPQILKDEIDNQSHDT